MGAMKRMRKIIATVQLYVLGSPKAAYRTLQIYIRKDVSQLGVFLGIIGVIYRMCGNTEKNFRSSLNLASDGKIFLKNFLMKGQKPSKCKSAFFLKFKQCFTEKCATGSGLPLGSGH